MNHVFEPAYIKGTIWSKNCNYSKIQIFYLPLFTKIENFLYIVSLNNI